MNTNVQPLRGFRWFLMSLLSLAAICARADPALALAQRVHDRPNGQDATSVTRMELSEKAGAKRLRELVVYRLDRGRGETASLVRFLGPADIAGIGLLSVDKADGSHEQWLYLPELDRVRRIAGERKGGRFVGSDIYYEDLQTRSPAADQHRLIGREAIAGVSCEMLESIPVDKTSSVYRRRVAWIDPQTAMPLRIDYFEKSDAEPSKRWVMLARKEVQGFMTVTDSKTVDLVTGHETRLVVDLVKYDRKLPARLFSQQMLADDSLESRYRP